MLLVERLNIVVKILLKLAEYQATQSTMLRCLFDDQNVFQEFVVQPLVVMCLVIDRFDLVVILRLLC